MTFGQGGPGKDTKEGGAVNEDNVKDGVSLLLSIQALPLRIPTQQSCRPLGAQQSAVSPCHCMSIHCNVCCKLRPHLSLLHS